MARAIDLDDREVREIKRGGNYLPRAKAIYKVRLHDFREFENDTNDGYEIEVEILKTIAAGKQHRDAQPPADEGAVLVYQFKNKAKFREEKVRQKQDLRVFLATMYGSDAGDEKFRANTALTALVKLADRDKLGDLDDFWIVVDIWPGKKPDPDTGRHYINMRPNFHPGDWKPSADAHRKRPDEEDDDPPARGRSASKRRDEEDEPPARGRSSRRADPDDEDDPPARGRSSRRAEPDDEEDDRPARGRRKPAEDDEPPPRRTRSRAAEEDDDPPARGRSSRRAEPDDEEDEDDRPARRRR